MENEMAKQTVTAYVCMEYRYTKDYSAQEWTPMIWGFKPGDEPSRVFLLEQDVSVDVPDNFNPIPQQVAALEAEKLKALDEYHASVAKINDQLSKLMAITNDA